jgi:hypothetical protein
MYNFMALPELIKVEVVFLTWDSQSSANFFDTYIP